ncbi:hypothetical protein ACIB24_11930 [Spongisporangium articulatum]|uniref:Glycosyl hydrolases family 43 n=1 Tax=Spongisporangium articulatum TaxID=3362603 RepID=A0ABW8AN09_9ACTN
MPSATENTAATSPVPLPDHSASQVAVRAPGSGPGWWAGAAGVAYEDGTYWLCYRLRRPVEAGRGVASVIAASTDGVHFREVAVVDRDMFGAASLERPALVRRPDGGWRLYVSCSTPGSKHWWIEALDADTVADLPQGKRSMVLPGDDLTAVKDPVVMRDGDAWRMWVCVHPLDDPDATDRMTTYLATSEDGLRWDVGPVALAARPGRWDARGARVTAVVAHPSSPGDLVAYYDGRATAEQNWHETTGVATGGGDGTFTALGTEPFARSPEGDGALRYLAIAALPDGAQRFYFESSDADGTHQLRTQLIPPSS